jgi:hypothetical protein
MGYLFGQKRRKVGRLQRQAAQCFLVMQEASSVELGTWCWPRVVLIEKRPLTESERSSMNRAARSVGARRIRLQGRSNREQQARGFPLASPRLKYWGRLAVRPAMLASLTERMWDDRCNRQALRSGDLPSL